MWLSARRTAQGNGYGDSAGGDAGGGSGGLRIMSYSRTGILNDELSECGFQEKKDSK